MCISETALAEKAREAMRFSYAPYSGCFVGAALLCEDGTVYTGCNVENASFGATNCAERTAVFKAVSEGKRRFQKIAIAGGKGGNISGVFAPCGICRQVLSEFMEAEAAVLLVTEDGYEKTSLGALLPYAFQKTDVLEESSEDEGNAGGAPAERG